MIIQIKDLGDFMTRFMKALDEQSPTWHFTYATQQQLAEFAYDTRRDYALHNLRQSVAQALTLPVRAAVHGGLVSPTLEPTKS